MSRNKVHTDRYKQINNVLKVIAAVAVFAVAMLLTVYFFPQISRLRESDVRDRVREYIQLRGAVGLLLMLGIQLVQVILSIIPGEPVEVLFGFVYGPWLGALLCLVGQSLGSFAVFSVTRALGKNFMHKIEDSGKYRKLSFLKEPKKRDTLIFLLFFLPGTPKDTLTYFAPFTGIELWKFMLISGVARIPSVITSAFAGNSIFAGDYFSSIIIFCITGLIGLIGIFVYNRLTSKQ